MGNIIYRKGEVSRANNGMLMTIIRYGNTGDIDVEFEDGTVVRNKQYAAFKKGKIRHPSINAKNNGNIDTDRKLYNSFNTWYNKHRDEFSCKDEAYNYYINNAKTNNNININGKIYKSFRDMCLSNGIHPDTIKGFFNRGVAKELKLNIDNTEHIVLVINMYNNIKNKKIIINGYIINKLNDIQNRISDITVCSRDKLLQIYTIILYSNDIQGDINRYIEKLKVDAENNNNYNTKRKEGIEEFRNKCIEAGIELYSEEYTQVRRNKDNHKDWSIEQCIEYVLNRSESRTEYKHKRDIYKQFREEHNIDKEEFRQISSYIRNQHKKGTDISLLDALHHVRHYNEYIDKEWKDKWSKVVESGILENTHRNSVVDYMKKHIDCSIEDIINHFKYEKSERKEYPKLKEYCNILKLSYSNIVGYINRNDCTMGQAIIHYRPDCYINWLGELVIPN